MQLKTLSLILILLAVLSLPAEQIILRSGNGSVGQRDSQINMLLGPADYYFSNTFTSTDFTNARNGVDAYIISNHSAWISALSGDSSSKWISTSFSGAGEGGTALYAIDFTITQPLTSATFKMNYAVDNLLGGNGQEGIFINGIAVSGTGGIGSFAGEYTIGTTNITSLLNVGTNTLYINSVDVGGPGGLLFRAEINTVYAPQPALTASNTNFGNVRVGTSGTASVTVSNSGQSGSTLTGTIGAASGSEFSPVSGTQSFSLAQSQSASRTFTYTPNARGNDSTTVSISSNATNTSRTLTGTGVSPVYSSSVAPNSTIDFGIVDKDQTLTQTLTIQNLTPDADLGNLTNMTVLSATISGEDASYYSLSGFTPGTVLAKNGSMTFSINATNPDHLVRHRNATLTIVTDVNAALGIAGNVYTYQLTAYTVPEPSTCLFLSIAGLILGISRLYRKYR